MPMTPKSTLSSVSTSLAISAVLLMLVCSCSTKSPVPARDGTFKPYRIGGKWYHPLPDAQAFRERGLASWYGKKFHGRKTANGETYNMYAMTAAHKTLPLGTLVSVRNLSNQKQVVVRINDRGPFVRKRIIDLSYTAARQLDITGPGTAPVEIEALRPGTVKPVTAGTDPRSIISDSYDQGNFVIQIGAFKDYGNAQRLVNQLNQTYKNVHIVPCDREDDTLYRVRVGRCSSLRQAYDDERNLIQNGFPDAFAVAEE